MSNWCHTPTEINHQASINQSVLINRAICVKICKENTPKQDSCFWNCFQHLCEYKNAKTLEIYPPGKTVPEPFNTNKPRGHFFMSTLVCLCLTWHIFAPVSFYNNSMLFGRTDVTTWCHFKQSTQMQDTWIHFPCNSWWRGSNSLMAWSC